MELSTNKPFSFKEWIKYQKIEIADKNYSDYLVYLKNWYADKNKISEKNRSEIKYQYIQLLKDLSVLFNEDEKNQFLKNLDFENDEEIIFTIPLFSKKLKEIGKVLINKRENIKNAKIKYNMVGSNIGLESLLYEYILKNFSKKENNITQIPFSDVQNFLPELSAVKDDFYIEIEELHDADFYHDSDPSLDISEYQDISKFLNDIPFNDFTEDEITKILSYRFLTLLSDSTVSKLFKSFVDTNDSDTANLLKLANQKYLGETVYALTAIRLSETQSADNVLNLPFAVGNNWFFWPSGGKQTNDSIFSNIYRPIPINNSNLINSGATGGDSYKNSDLIFTEKNNTIEGAWLLGELNYRSVDTMEVSFEGNSEKQFIYPFPFFTVDSKTLNFSSYSINENFKNDFNLLQPSSREKLLQQYFTQTLPNSSSIPLSLNRTSLVDNGAFAGTTNLNSDTIFKKNTSLGLEAIYSESSDSAFLYKIQKTDLPITNDINYIYWPLITFKEQTDIPITIIDDYCLDIPVNQIDTSQMVGSVAGFDFNTSDVIFKLNSRTNEPIEAAYLKTASTDELDLLFESITIYDKESTRCSKYISGPIQRSLSLKINPLEKVSFIWNGVDEYADNVFKFIEHSDDCEFKNNENDFYKDQDYVNPEKQIKHDWKKCSCKSVYFSPIGHSGQKMFEFNGTTDLLFHDPDGMGNDFSLNNWYDTRGLSFQKSPQFSFYQLDSNEKRIGWGKGKWKTGNGQRMVLKTGRRYTYYRTSLRKDIFSNDTTPYYIVKHPYKKIVGICEPKPIDVAIVWDISKTQTNVFPTAKEFIKSYIRRSIGKTGSLNQIALIAFDNESVVIGYLTNNENALRFLVNEIKISPFFPN
jgi:hypothetical protein